MHFRLLFMLIILSLLVACSIREDSSLPSGIRPFEIVEDAIYLTEEGVYDTNNDTLFIKVELEELPTRYNFIESQYDYISKSSSFKISYVTIDGEEIAHSEDYPLLAFKSNNFDYLNLYTLFGPGRFYNYPTSDTLTGYSSQYSDGYCYFYISDSGYYQTVTGSNASYEVSYTKGQSTMANLSINQAQFIMEDSKIPDEVNSIKLIHNVDSDYIAEYDLIFDSNTAETTYDMVLNHISDTMFPLMYIPFPSDIDPENLYLKQLLENDTELIFNLNDAIDIYTDTKTIGNCFLILINNPGKFIIGEKLK